MTLRPFLAQLDHDRIVAAIREAESRSSGEIRVHVAREAVGDPEQAAAARFEKLGMTATRERNGVLIFVAPKSRAFAVIGDAAIHERCGPGFWAGIASAMEADFRKGAFTDGIVKAITEAGTALARHFPRSAGDVDELSDEVTED